MLEPVLIWDFFRKRQLSLPLFVRKSRHQDCRALCLSAYRIKIDRFSGCMIACTRSSETNQSVNIPGNKGNVACPSFERIEWLHFGQTEVEVDTIEFGQQCAIPIGR